METAASSHCLKIPSDALFEITVASFPFSLKCSQVLGNQGRQEVFAVIFFLLSIVSFKPFVNEKN